MLSLPLWLLSTWLSFLATALAKPCVGFDTNWGLYVFGLQHDVSLGPSSIWNANPLGMGNLTRTGRPPFNGPNTQCFFSQYQNALYVLNADTTQPSNLHIFSFETQAWTTQQIAADGTDPNSLVAILDRDTNVFFALSGGGLYSLDMGTLSQADGTTRGWNFVQSPDQLQTAVYPAPVMALAQNHVHFLGTSTSGAPTVDIFVIHFSFMQPDPQVFAPIEVGGSGFPSATHGTAASIFKGLDSVQQKFAFIPDDGSSTYIFDVIANTTQQIQGPTAKNTGMIAASRSELVQMTTTGEVYWLPIDQDNAQANYGATWSKIALNIPLAPAIQEDPTTNMVVSTGTHIGTSTVPTSVSSSSAALRKIHDDLMLGLFMVGLGLYGLWSSF